MAEFILGGTGHVCLKTKLLPISTLGCAHPSIQRSHSFIQRPHSPVVLQMQQSWTPLCITGTNHKMPPSTTTGAHLVLVAQTGQVRLALGQWNAYGLFSPYCLSHMHCVVAEGIVSGTGHGCPRPSCCPSALLAVHTLADSGPTLLWCRGRSRGWLRAWLTPSAGWAPLVAVNHGHHLTSRCYRCDKQLFLQGHAVKVPPEGSLGKDIEDRVRLQMHA